MVLLLNLCPTYLWLLRLGFERKKCLHSILDVDWLCLSASVFVCFWYLFLVLSATQSWKGSKRSACFGPNIIIHSLSDQRYLHIDHIWRGDWDLVFHPTTPKIWFSQWYLVSGQWQPPSEDWPEHVKTPSLPPCSVTGDENIGYSLALSGPGAVTIGVGTSRGADSWKRRKLLHLLSHSEESQTRYWHGVAGSPASPGNHLKQKLNGFLSQPSGLTSSHFRRVNPGRAGGISPSDLVPV